MRQSILYCSPNSVHTVGVLAVTLGLADWFVGNLDVYGDKTFVCRRGTSCMLPRSRAGETVGRVTFCRKTQWFQHTFPLSPESGPGGLREIPDASRGLLGAPEGLSGGAPRGPSGILLPGLLLQVPSSGVPPQGILLRIPLPGFLPQDSMLRSLLKDSSSRISP